MAKKFSKKMADFADNYLETGNIYQSAIKAGYSENYAKGNASRLLENESVKIYIKERMAKLQSQKIADIQEVLEYLTKGIRQELEEEVVVVEGVGEGVSNARTIVKKISLKESTRCAELLGKRYSLFSDNVNVAGSVPVTIVEDLGDDD